jgi:glycosyltransferase involved in cell wall biosynthesis
VKILYYTDAFWPQIGGIETFSLRLIEGLESSSSVAARMDVVVVTNTPGPEHFTEQNRISALIVRKPSPLQLWKLIGAADRVVSAGAAILPLAFSLARRKRLIVTHHGYQTICPNGLLFHLPSRTNCPGHFEKKDYSECVRCSREELSWAKTWKRLVLTSVRRLLTKRAWRNVMLSDHLSSRLHLPNSSIIRNGVSQVEPLDRSIPSREKKMGFAYLGRLVVEKGAHVLIEAARILKNRGQEFRVLLIGDGPEKEPLLAQVREANLDATVEFLGFRTGEKLWIALSEPCVLVMPSVCQDVAPFAPLEQMMMGRTIIASDIGGLSEEVGDTGLKFRPGNAEELADRMEQAMATPELLTELGKRARQRTLELYTAEKMIGEYRKLLIAERRKTREESRG